MIRFKKRCSTSLTLKPVNTYSEEYIYSDFKNKSDFTGIFFWGNCVIETRNKNFQLVSQRLMIVATNGFHSTCNASF